MKIDKKIFEAVMELLKEEEEARAEAPKEDAEADKKSVKEPANEKKKKESTSSKKIRAQGAFGKGGWSQQLQVAESRSIDDPAGLTKDLGITSASGKNDLEKASSVLEQAIKNNKIMGEAFNNPAIQKIKAGKREVEICQITPANADVSYRNGAKYIYLTLVAAENAGILKMKRGVRFLSREKTQFPTLTSI